jgi:hypothetical protein
MRRILIVVGLVVLLAAVIVVPAMAAPSSGDERFREALASALGPALGLTLGQEEAENVLRNWLGPEFIVRPIDNTNSPENGGPSRFFVRPIDDTNSSENDIPSGFIVRPIDNSSSGGSSGISSSTGDPDNPSVSQEFSERRIESGSASPSSSFSNSGNNVNACPTNQQVVNTGNVANQQGVTQYNSTTDDIDATGSSINITSDQTVTCDQTLNQAAEAGQ